MKRKEEQTEKGLTDGVNSNKEDSADIREMEEMGKSKRFHYPYVVEAVADVFLAKDPVGIVEAASAFATS